MKRFLADIKKYREYAIYSAKSGLKAEVADSHLSWLWWILDPLLFMLVYSFVAIIVFGKGEKYFAAFVFIGLSSWRFFSGTIKQSVRMVSKNSAIVSKIYMPKYVLIIIQMLINAFKMFISFSLVAGAMVLYLVPVSYRLLYIIPCMLVLFIVTFGFSCIALHFGVYVDDLSNLINVFLQLVFYLSGIFYSIETRVGNALGAGYVTLFLRCNPAALVIDSLRKCMLYNTEPDFAALGLWLVAGCIFSAIGIRLIYKNENSYVKIM